MDLKLIPARLSRLVRSEHKTTSMMTGRTMRRVFENRSTTANAAAVTGMDFDKHARFAKNTRSSPTGHAFKNTIVQTRHSKQCVGDPTCTGRTVANENVPERLPRRQSVLQSRTDATDPTSAKEQHPFQTQQVLFLLLSGLFPSTDTTKSIPGTRHITDGCPLQHHIMHARALHRRSHRFGIYSLLDRQILKLSQPEVTPLWLFGCSAWDLIHPF